MSADSSVRKWEARLGISSTRISPNNMDIGESAIDAIKGPLASIISRIVRAGIRVSGAALGVYIEERTPEVALAATGLPVALRLLPSPLTQRYGRIGDLNAPFLGDKSWKYAVARCDRGWLVVAGDKIAPESLVSFATLAGTLWKQERETLQTRAAAEIDTITGLFNRTGLYARMAQAPRSYVVVFADLDDLKVVNDRDGHAAGDRLLKATASVLSSAVRTGDFVGRIGGDEFVVVAFGESPESLLSRLRGAFTRARIRCSFGASIVPAEAIDFDAAVKIADDRMYNDKKTRKGAAVR